MSTKFQTKNDATARSSIIAQWLPRPITATQTSRYGCKVSLVRPPLQTIALGLDNITPPYLPESWAQYINPEGQAYFAGSLPLRVVTEERLHIPEVLERVLKWISFFAQRLKECEIKRPETVELYLELSPEGCSYYLVDHFARREFWLEDVPVDVLDLPECDSATHLGYKLEEHYWTHVEHFPMHTGGIPRSVVNDLWSIFLQGTADQMTSNCSPFPYCPDECGKFMKLLEGAKASDQVTDGNIIFTVARLWSVISDHRFNTRYGEEAPKFAREQSTLGCPRRSRFLTRLVSSALWELPQVYINKFDNLYADNIVYTNHWRAFMSRCEQDWHSTMTYSLMFSITDTLLLLKFSYHLPLGIVSLLLCIGSILTALGLSAYHEEQKEAVSAEAATYLDSVQSERWGFDLIGIVYSLPKAFFTWALVLFASQSAMLAFNFHGLYAALVMTATVMCIARAGRTYLDGSLPWSPGIAWSRLCRPFSKPTPEEDLPI